MNWRVVGRSKLLAPRYTEWFADNPSARISIGPFRTDEEAWAYINRSECVMRDTRRRAQIVSMKQKAEADLAALREDADNGDWNEEDLAREEGKIEAFETVLRLL